MRDYVIGRQEREQAEVHRCYSNEGLCSNSIKKTVAFSNSAGSQQIIGMQLSYSHNV